VKHIAFLIFFTVFFGIFLLGSWFVYSKGLQALHQTHYKTAFVWVFWGLTLSFILGQFLERGTPTQIGQIITYVGSFWLAILWYLFIFVLIISLLKITNHWFHYIPNTWVNTYFTGKNLFFGVSAITLLLVLYGHINAIMPRVVNIDINIDKQGVQKNIKIALVTDIHMGYIIGSRRVLKLVKLINAQNVDLVLFGGDLVDHNPLPVIKNNMGKYFNNLNPPLGKFAVTGNHEFIGKPDVSINYLSQFGIRYIRDTVIDVNGIILLAGRDDKDKKRFTGNARMPINLLLKNIDKSKPIILIDHQPVEFDSVAKNGVDLMVSGHTHKGQFWPFGIITKKVFELDWGLIKKGNTHFYVSSGYGTWGPPVRIGNRPEIVILNLKLN